MKSWLLYHYMSVKCPFIQCLRWRSCSGVTVELIRFQFGSSVIVPLCSALCLNQENSRLKVDPRCWFIFFNQSLGYFFSNSFITTSFTKTEKEEEAWQALGESNIVMMCSEMKRLDSTTREHFTKSHTLLWHLCFFICIMMFIYFFVIKYLLCAVSFILVMSLGLKWV